MSKKSFVETQYAWRGVSSSPALLPTHISSPAHLPSLIYVRCRGLVQPASGNSVQRVSTFWGETSCWHQERDLYVSINEHSWMATEVYERFWCVERGMWECRIGTEGVRSVPLVERIVIWTGKRELLLTSVSTFLNPGSFNYQAESGSWWRLASSLRDVPYLELLVKSILVQKLNVNRIDSKIPVVPRLIVNILDI